MWYSTQYFFITIFQLLTTFQFEKFLSIDDFKDEWFARFWGWFGPKSRESGAPAVIPLIQNHARGVCLDIGPGTGQWLTLFSRANNPGITKIYGVEPNRNLHKALRESAVRAGLEDVYEIIGCGAEELQSKGGLDKESVDTIITVQCLCSIPTPELIIRELYPLLKPGGQWLVFEHIKTRYRGHFVDYHQSEYHLRTDIFDSADETIAVINVAWKHMFGGCNITRPTDKWLMSAGEWESVDLNPGKGEGPYDTVPHVVGTLTKKR